MSALGGNLREWIVVPINTGTSVAVTHHNSLLDVTATGSPVAITLPSASGIPSGFIVRVRRNPASDSNATISGGATATLTASDSSREFQCDGSAWVQWSAGGAGGVTDGDKGDITVTSSGATWTIDTNVVTNAKSAQMAASTIKGNNTASLGDPVDMTVSQAKALLAYTAADVGAAATSHTIESHTSSDVTTLNVDNTKHGLFPKLPSVTDGKYYGIKDGAVAEVVSGSTLASDREVSTTKAVAASDSRVRNPFTINYCKNPDAEIDASGWAAYADAAGVMPVDGTGGSPGVSVTRSTTYHPRGAASIGFGHPASNCQGQGISYDFTIDTADCNSQLTISGEVYLPAASSYVANDISIWVFDVTNGVLVPISGGNQLAPAINTMGQKFALQFSTNTSTSYRLIFHYAGTTASSLNVYFDSIYVGPTFAWSGPAMSDWQDYTPTFVGLGTVTGLKASWRRVGDTMSIRATLTTGTCTTVVASMTLPSVSFDTTKMSNRAYAGWGQQSSSGNTDFAVLTDGATATDKVYFNRNAGATGLVPENGNSVFYDSNSVSFVVENIPIAGWSGSTAVQPGSRYLWAQRYASTATRVTTTPSAPGQYRARRLGTDTAPGTAPAEGNGFFVGAGSGLSAGVINLYDIYIGPGKVVQLNGYGTTGRTGQLVTDYWQFSATPSVRGMAFSYDPTTGVASIYCSVTNANDYVGTSSDLSTLYVSGYFDILVADDPVPVALAPAVHVDATSNAGQVCTALTTNLQYEDEVIDTHGAWSTDTFTAPVAGTYLITTSTVDTTTVAFGLVYYKNGTRFDQSVSVAGDSNIAGTAVLKLAAGDTLTVRVNVGITRGTNSYNNRLSITRIGDT